MGKLLGVLSDKLQNNEVNVIIAEAPDTSESCAMYEKEHGVTFIKCVKKGRAFQMNRGFGRSNADVVMFLHADVRPPDDFVDQIHKAIANGYEMGFFSYKFDSSSLLLKINSFFTRFDSGVAGGGDQCHFFDRETFISLNGYNERFTIMEDFDMMRRIRNHNIPYKIIKSDALVSARKYDKNAYLKVNYVNMIAMRKFHKEVDIDTIKAYYESRLVR